MGEWITLTAADGAEISAYEAVPANPRGGIVVIQEIFGVNSHIRSLVDRYADEGYATVAPALFDRQQPGFESGYSPEEIEKARAFLQDIDWDAMLKDADAAARRLRDRGVKVGVVGFCLGGSVAYLAAARLDGLAAASCYYGGRIKSFADEAPRCPTIMHFGETDHTIPMADVEAVRAKRPDCEIHVYPAGHGFSCDQRASYHADSARTAHERTMKLFAAHLG